MTTAKKTANKTARKSAAPKPEKPRGTISPGQVTAVICEARKAYAYQDPGISFEAFYREVIFDAFGRPGLTACDDGHFCELMGHFCTGSGNDDEALKWFLKAAKNDESKTAWSIADILTKHIALAHSTVEALTAATPPRKLKTLLAAREAILDHPEGPLNFGDLLTIVRGKTRRPTLTLDADLAKSLAERCDKPQLAQIRFTLINRRNEREGRGNTCDRNKSQNSNEAKRRRSRHELDDRRW